MASRGKAGVMYANVLLPPPPPPLLPSSLPRPRMCDAFTCGPLREAWCRPAPRDALGAPASRFWPMGVLSSATRSCGPGLDAPLFRTRLGPREGPQSRRRVLSLLPALSLANALSLEEAEEEEGAPGRASSALPAHAPGAAKAREGERGRQRARVVAAHRHPPLPAPLSLLRGGGGDGRNPPCG